MNILKVLGIVAGIHVVAFFLMFVNPGCRSTSQHPAPAADDTAPPAAVTPATAPAPADSGAGGAPGVSVSLGSPAPARYPPTRPGTPASAALENTPLNDVTPATTYSVVRGDTLTRIARKNKTTVAELMKANHLTSNSVLDVGEKLIIPGKAPAAASGGSGSAEPLAAGAVYKVKAGDTLASIAQRAGSTTAELKQLNDLKSDYVLVGQELKLPSGSAPAPEEAKVSRPAPAAGTHARPVKTTEGASASRAASVKTPDGAVTHEVKPGETVGAIAKKYHVRTQDLLVANNIADPRKIQSGQILVIPGGAATGTASPTVAPSIAAPAGPAPASGASASDTSAAPAQPANNQDLDTGLKPQGAVPVIKVDDAGETKTP